MPHDAHDEKGNLTEAEDAAQDVLDAIRDRDPRALCLALQRHQELSEADRGDSGDGDGSGDEAPSKRY